MSMIMKSEYHKNVTSLLMYYTFGMIPVKIPNKNLLWNLVKLILNSYEKEKGHKYAKYGEREKKIT